MIVVLAEKPSVGRDLARILGANRRHNGWMEGNGYAVTWGFGHLIELQEPDAYDPALKRWTLQSLPIVPQKFELKISSAKGVKEQFTTIKKLFKDADSIVCATDAGREGELIFRYILEMCQCTKKPAQRLWISSLTDEAIKEGFQKLKDIAEYNNLAAAAKCRAQADWIVGLNATRGYTVKYSRGQGVLSVGRVQTPVLALIVNRDREIRSFVPEDYWEVWTSYRDVKFKHKKNRFDKKDQAETLIEKVAPEEFEITKIEEKNASSPPPQLFDLTGLQKSMNRMHNLTANETLSIAQGLYEKKFISYPRTDSCYLSEDLYAPCKQTLSALTRNYEKQITPLNLDKLTKSKRFFNSAKVTDHHAIIPTKQIPYQLNDRERLVYEAIVLRFIAIFYPNCEKAHTTVSGEAAKELFKAKGTRILKPGWTALYGDESDEQLLPNFEKGERGPHKPELKTCKTKPPNFYNEATLLSSMETAGKNVDDEELKEAMKERGLGTPATRASIIETLLKRGYIYKEKKQLRAAAKGEELIRLMQAQPVLTSAEMTAEWEHKLKQIERGLFSAEEFMSGIKEFTSSVVQALTEPLKNFGSCPLCQSPVIKGNTGWGCSEWKTGCTFRLPKAQFGSELSELDVQALLFDGALAMPRKLKLADGKEITGTLLLEKNGLIKPKEVEAKSASDALGNCPKCASSIVERPKSYSCISCDFIIWKKIAKRDISKTVAKALLEKGQSQILKGFKSKAGKEFSAALALKEGQVSFDFSPVNN